MTSRYTERQMLDALHVRYSQRTQGANLARYVCAEHVRASCGYSGFGVNPDGELHSRTMCTADFLAQDTRGLLLHGHEVKVSRSDWLTEISDPTKAEAIKRYCDRWWLVAPDKSIVRDDLPDDWGLIAFDRNQIYRRAPALAAEPHPPTFL